MIALGVPWRQNLSSVSIVWSQNCIMSCQATRHVALCLTNALNYCLDYSVQDVDCSPWSCFPVQGEFQANFRRMKTGQWTCRVLVWVPLELGFFFGIIAQQALCTEYNVYQSMHSWLKYALYTVPNSPWILWGKPEMWFMGYKQKHTSKSCICIKMIQPICNQASFWNHICCLLVQVIIA